MNNAESTYSRRRRAISDLLELLVDMSSMLPSNTASTFDATDETFTNSLVCSWNEAGKEYSDRTIYVHIHQTTDSGKAAERIREMMREEASSTGRGVHSDAEALEINTDRDNEHVFVVRYLSKVQTIVGRCFLTMIVKPFDPPVDSLLKRP
ncbi:hypothetical protein LV457_10815 [Mycobacterium sp. MYCO198283]|uniref:hypothetical protein n=1 Tax=Mycobacterium sp. MYCO198283 TaxID=2883505 RepID=UPI001E2F5276|nr:hypothetical protein [Mycobacterium sp. MYCO198283]MCG5432778.1 hypothetical protein [Mycobacterium sp. MYCO198283]